MGRSPGDVQGCSSCTFYVVRSTCEMHCNKSNGMIMHFYLCNCSVHLQGHKICVCIGKYLCIQGLHSGLC